MGRRRNPSKIPQDQTKVPGMELPTTTFTSVLARMSVPSCLHSSNAVFRPQLSTPPQVSPTATIASIPYFYTLLDLFDELCNVYPPFDLLRWFHSNRKQFMVDIVRKLSSRTCLSVLLVSWITLRSLEQ